MKKFLKRITKEEVNIPRSERVKINSLEDLVLFENSKAFAEIEFVETTPDLFRNKELHFLFFVGKKIILQLEKEQGIESAFLNPMVEVLCISRSFEDINFFPTQAENYEDIKNFMCHIDVKKIKKYSNISIEDMIKRVWNYFLVYDISNVEEKNYSQEYEKLASNLGTINEGYASNNRGTKFSKMRDVKYNPKINHYFASNKRQPLHNDYAYYSTEEHPDWVMLYCVHPSEFGGITSFLSTKKLKNILEKYNKELLEEALNTKILYGRAKESHSEINEKILFDGTQINWNYWQIKGDLNDEQSMKIREKLFNFLEDFIEAGQMYDMSKKWKSRDCIIFNDHLIMHCRSAFLGHRWLKGCAFSS